MLMARGRGCFAPAILQATVDIQLSETGNYTVMGLKQTGHHEFSHSKGTLSSSFLQEVWVMLVTSLVALQAL
ncbi:CD160 molecule [Phyllostomus discolor]|uniref:CD160 molecule n=1 Tax=Phyllostomus discolor TaxID=89673 RepID=A0A833YHZ7_9CHIR|nr:CD160 molecule [Phyllostomus discolor]